MFIKPDKKCKEWWTFLFVFVYEIGWCRLQVKLFIYSPNETSLSILKRSPCLTMLPFVLYHSSRHMAHCTNISPLYFSTGVAYCGDSSTPPFPLYHPSVKCEENLLPFTTNKESEALIAKSTLPPFPLPHSPSLATSSAPLCPLEEIKGGGGVFWMIPWQVRFLKVLVFNLEVPEFWSYLTFSLSVERLCCATLCLLCPVIKTEFIMDLF